MFSRVLNTALISKRTRGLGGGGYGWYIIGGQIIGLGSDKSNSPKM